MNKRELIILLIIWGSVFLLIFLNYNLTGFSVSGNFEGDKGGGGFAFSGLGYKLIGNNMIVDYKIKEFGGVDRELRSYYTIFDENGKRVTQGEQEIVLSSLSEGSYRFSFDMPYELNSGKVRVSAWDNGESHFAIIDMGSSAGMTGNIISEITKTRAKELTMIFGAFLLLFAILFFVYKYHRKIEKDVYNPDVRKFIQFDLD